MGHYIPPVDGKPVIVALDLTDRAQSCLAHGCEMARKLGRPLVVAHVVHENSETLVTYRRHQKLNDTTPLIDVAHGLLQEQVAALRASSEDLKDICDVRIAVADGVPETRIPELAARYDASMIVMCSRNRTGLGRWLHGSVTDTVMRRANCPVVVMGQGETDKVPDAYHRPLVRTPAALQGG